MTAVALQTHLKPTFLKDHVYENRPQFMAELKVAITQKIRAIGKEECVRVTAQLRSSVYRFLNIEKEKRKKKKEKEEEVNNSPDCTRHSHRAVAECHWGV